MAEQVKPGEYITIYANQGDREAFVLAVLDGEALLEYEMPKGTTALRVVPVNDPDTTRYKTMAYTDIPNKWIEAMLEEDTLRLMEGNPQGAGLNWKKFNKRVEKLLAKGKVSNV